MLKTKLTLVALLLIAVHALWAQELPIETVVQRGHRGAVKTVAFTPDGRHLATGSRDNSIKLWELSSGREIRTFLGHLSTVNTVVFDQSGTKMASGASDNQIIVWEVATGKEITRLTGHKDRVTSFDVQC